MLANRIVAIDHGAQRTELLALRHEGDEGEDAERWLDEAEAVVRDVLATSLQAPAGAGPAERTGAAEPAGRTEQAMSAGRGAMVAGGSSPAATVTFRCGRGREQYLADIARCQAALAAGESYEVCLTDQISTPASPDPFELYRVLRHINPAPFAAYLKLGDLAVLSSSPERFLSVDRDRRVQARPIKGTTPRSEDPLLDAELRAGLTQDEKTYAEHLMIVDLLRNDLGRVCEIDSVRVPELMIVEDYATVHQLISTVTGVLENGRTSVECVRACFPGGSMTGAPKLRTMEIIDDIEREARGVYSGAIGYFGLDGSVDLSIVIRTIVMRPGATTIGAGGAIVMQSDPQEEFDEILLKARAPMAAIAKAVTGSDSPDALTVELEPPFAHAVRAA
jgi:para-aminobenzoate synthetase